MTKRKQTTAPLHRRAARTSKTAQNKASERKRLKPRSIGAFKSGRHDIAQRADELLSGFGEN